MKRLLIELSMEGSHTTSVGQAVNLSSRRPLGGERRNDVPNALTHLRFEARAAINLERVITLKKVKVADKTEIPSRRPLPKIRLEIDEDGAVYADGYEKGCPYTAGRKPALRCSTILTTMSRRFNVLSRLGPAAKAEFFIRCGLWRM